MWSSLCWSMVPPIKCPGTPLFSCQIPKISPISPTVGFVTNTRVSNASTACFASLASREKYDPEPSGMLRANLPAASCSPDPLERPIGPLLPLSKRTEGRKGLWRPVHDTMQNRWTEVGCSNERGPLPLNTAGKIPCDIKICPQGFLSARAMSSCVGPSAVSP